MDGTSDNSDDKKEPHTSYQHLMFSGSSYKFLEMSCDLADCVTRVCRSSPVFLKSFLSYVKHMDTNSKNKFNIKGWLHGEYTCPDI